jgi:hypothetical protein
MAHSCGHECAKIVAKSAGCVKGDASVAWQDKPVTGVTVYQACINLGGEAL